MFPFPSPLLTVAPAGIPAGTIRASGIIAVPSSASQVVTFPGTAVAGDYMVIFGAHAFIVNVPSGWTLINQPSSGSNVNGATFAKTLSAGDISTGSVTVTFTGAFTGKIGYVVFVGGVTGVRTSEGIRSAGASGARALTTSASTPAIGDVALYWAADRVGSPGVTTLDRGTIIQHDETGGWGGALSNETLSAGGAVTVNWNYHAGDSGDYACIVVIQP